MDRRRKTNSLVDILKPAAIRATVKTAVEDVAALYNCEGEYYFSQEDLAGLVVFYWPRSQTQEREKFDRIHTPHGDLKIIYTHLRPLKKEEVRELYYRMPPNKLTSMLVKSASHDK